MSLRDALPAGLTTIDGQSTVVVDLGDIPAGQTRNATAHLKAAHSGRFSSSATVKSDAGDAASPLITTIARQPKLQLSIKGPEKEYLGKRVVYQVTITNRGDIAAQRATLRFSPSDGGKAISVTDAEGSQIAPADDGNANGASGLGTIDPGTSKVVNATFEPINGGVFKVDALASAKCATDATQSASTDVVAVAALLLEAADVEDPVAVGKNVVYKIKVTNQGNGSDSNIRVTAILPAEEEFVKADGITAASVDGQTISFAPVTSLAAKDVAVWEITARALQAGNVEFKVNVTSDSVRRQAGKTESTKLY